MKNFFTQATLSLLVGGAILSAVAGGPEAPPMVTPGLYIGLGGAYNTYFTKNSYSASGTITNNVTGQSYSKLNLLNNNYSGSGNFSNDTTQDQFAGMVQIGYWMPIDNTWLWGLQASYKYTNYSYNTIMNAADQNISTKAFSALSGSQLTAPISVTAGTTIPTYWFNQNSLVPTTDFNATTSFNNELLLLAYFGVQFETGYAYLGLGAVMFTYKDRYQMATVWNLNDTNTTMGAYNGIPVTGVVAYTTSTNPLQQIVQTNNAQSVINTPIFIANNGSQSKHTTIWGGAFQVGYNYYFLPTWFLNVNYTYTLTGTYKFTTTIANPNVTWFNNPIPSTSQWASTAGTYTGTTLSSTLNLPSFNPNNANNVFGLTNFSLSRKIQLEAQEFMFSINKVFAL